MLAQPRLLDSECGGGAQRARDSHVKTLRSLVERRLQARGGLISVQTEYDRIMVSYTTRHVYYAMSVCLSVAICCLFAASAIYYPPKHARVVPCGTGNERCRSVAWCSWSGLRPSPPRSAGSATFSPGKRRRVHWRRTRTTAPTLPIPAPRSARSGRTQASATAAFLCTLSGGSSRVLVTAAGSRRS